MCHIHTNAVDGDNSMNLTFVDEHLGWVNCHRTVYMNFFCIAIQHTLGAALLTLDFIHVTYTFLIYVTR